jgi:hypothetical protein
VPAAAASAYASQTISAPENASAVSARATTIDAVCVTMTRRRLSKRSATTPEIRPKMVNGAKRQKARKPTATAEWVSSTTYQASAMFCIQVPTRETTCPVKNSR